MKLLKTKKYFGWIFFVSSIVVFVLLVYLAYNDVYLFSWFYDYLDHKHFPTYPNHSVEINLSVIISIISLLTSLASLLGFVSATILAWRKEHRELRFENLEMEKRKLEIEKLKKELDIIDDTNDRKA